MLTDALDFELPEDRIAVTPAEPRDSARLMVCDRASGNVLHHHVRDLPRLGLLQSGDVMLVNQSRVLPAKFAGVRTDTGGRVEGLYLGETMTGQWTALFESRGKLTAGESITLNDQTKLRLAESMGAGQWQCDLESELGTLTVLEAVGETPLPPYIRRARKKLGLAEVGQTDQQRYNTVYAEGSEGSEDSEHEQSAESKATDIVSGSVAAPTAGLHFTPELLDQLASMNIPRHSVTLHVGMGTFAPVRTDNLEDHPMHSEHIEVTPDTVAAMDAAHARGRKVFAVGTTTVRAIESLPRGAEAQGIAGPTDLYILPGKGFEFRYTDMLMTNFHLPKSTLLAMVSALPGVGVDRLLGWYAQAVEQGYRFYSYGDAMLIV